MASFSKIQQQNKHEEYYHSLRAELAHAFLRDEEDKKYEEEKVKANTFTKRLGLGVKRMGLTLRRAGRSVYKGAVDEVLTGGGRDFEKYVQERTADLHQFVDEVKNLKEDIAGDTVLKVADDVEESLHHLSDSKEWGREIDPAVRRLQSTMLALQKMGLTEGEIAGIAGKTSVWMDAKYSTSRVFHTGAGYTLPTPATPSLAEKIYLKAIDDDGLEIEQRIIREMYTIVANKVKTIVGSGSLLKKDGVLYVTRGTKAYPIEVRGMNIIAKSIDGKTEIPVTGPMSITPGTIHSVTTAELVPAITIDLLSTPIIVDSPETYAFLHEEMLSARLMIAGKHSKLDALDSAAFDSRSRAKKNNKGEWVAKRTFWKDATSRQAVDKYATMAIGAFGYGLKGLGTGIMGPAAIPVVGATLGVTKAGFEYILAQNDITLVVRELPAVLAEAGSGVFSEEIDKALRGMKVAPNLQKLSQIIATETPDTMIHQLESMSKMLTQYLRKLGNKANTLAHFELIHLQRVVENRIMRKQREDARNVLRAHEAAGTLTDTELNEQLLEINFKDNVETQVQSAGNDVRKAYEKRIKSEFLSGKKVMAHMGYAMGAHAVGAAFKEAVDILGVRDVSVFGWDIPTGGGNIEHSEIAKIISAETQHVQNLYHGMTSWGSNVLSYTSPFRIIKTFAAEHPEIADNALLLMLLGGGAGALGWRVGGNTIKGVAKGLKMDKAFGWGKKNVYGKGKEALGNALKKHEKKINTGKKGAAWFAGALLTFPVTWPLTAAWTVNKLSGDRIRSSIVDTLMKADKTPDEMIAAVQRLNLDLVDKNKDIVNLLNAYATTPTKDISTRDTLTIGLNKIFNELENKHPLLPLEFFKEARAKVKIIASLDPTDPVQEKRIDTFVAHLQGVYANPFEDHKDLL